MKKVTIPVMAESSEPSELIERNIRRRLASSSLTGNGKFKIRTASGCFNEFVLKSKEERK
jgi:hypothetical protein